MRRWIAAGLLIGSLALSPECGAEPKATIEVGADAAMQAAIVDASTRISNHQAAEGLRTLEPIIATLEHQATALQARGLVFCAVQPAEALLYATFGSREGKLATVLGGDLCTALFFKAYALTELGRKEEAVATLERLVALAPMRAHYFVELGYAYRESGQMTKAREAYQHAVDYADVTGDAKQAKRDRAAGRRGLGYILVELGDLDGGEKMYRLSQEDDPDSSIAKSELEFIAKHRRP